MKIRKIIKLLHYEKKLTDYLYDKSDFFHSFKNLENKIVERETFLLEKSNNKSILHFGFLDSPFLKKKFQQKQLLHLELKNVATYLYGIDIDKRSLLLYQKLTKDHLNSICDIERKLSKVEINKLSQRFDVILFPEILEHLKNPGIALENLRQLSLSNNSCEVIVTVPNAFYVGGILAALESNEVVHSGHYFYFSPYTLENLLKNCKFSQISIYFYTDNITSQTPGITKRGLIAVCQP